MTKPTLTASSLYLSDREKIWAAIRELNNTSDMGFTREDIRRKAKVASTKINDYLRNLMAAGMVRKVSQDKQYTKALYMLIVDCGVNAPRLRRDGSIVPPDGRQRMWDAMYVLGIFTLEELIACASLTDAPIKEGEAKYYCAWLVKCGYLLSNDAKTYTYVPIMRHGPKAPKIQRIKRLLDPNTGEVFGVNVETDRG